jgi:two-component system cell cycle sensor histidine kinase/response regulator CckA
MMTILTVGRAANAASLDALLAAAGHRVIRARGAGEAVLRARASPPDLVLVDGPFSSRSSTGLVARLRAEPATRGTPTLLLGAASFVAQLNAIGLLAPDASLAAEPRVGVGWGGLAPGDEASRLLAAALKAAANAIVITDREGRITWANPAFTRLTGWSLAEVAGLNPKFLKSGRHGPAFYDELWQTILSGQVWQGEMVNRRKDGTLYHEQQTITPLRASGGGEISHFVAVKVDVSGRRAAREALLQSERRHRRLAEAAHDDIYIVDRDGSVLYTNAAGAARLGRPVEQILGRRLSDVLPVETASRFLRDARRVLASGEALYVEDRSEVDGREVWSGTWLTPLTGEGGLASVEAVSRDITARVAAEQALRASEQRYRSLFERNLAGVYRMTLEGRIVECNDAFARILGYPSAAELRGLRPEDLYTSPALRRAFVERLLAEETLVNHESEGRRKDGGAVWVLENATLVREEGGPFIEGTIVDITERKTLERQLGQAQKMEAVGHLAGGVAHDFSNILSVIGGCSELALRRADAESPLRPYLDEIRRAADRSTGLVRQLLAFSRGQTVEPRVLDLDDVVRGIEEMLRALIPESIELVTSLHACPGLAKADRGQLEQVVVNLAVNARDAMPRGGRLSIETARTDLDAAYCRRHVGATPGPHVVLSVTDTGVGMDADTQAKIFDPFFTTKEAGRGTGLGLATVYGIVRRAGGSIWVYSEPGRGTVFKIYLPEAEKEEPMTESPGPVEVDPAAAPRGTETILLVEDEEALRALARELLASLGYTVLEARHGEEALQLSRSSVRPIHLLVTDLVMPQVDGRELAARIAAERPETRVLFVSGYAESTDPRSTLRASHVAFLQKPYTAAALATSIRRLLDDG